MRVAELARILRFAAVGLAAAATHYASVIALVEGFFGTAVAPLSANVGGFAVAFWVSYAGHRFWTFGDRVVSGGGSFIRFLGTALLGFGMNELLFYGLLNYTNMPYFIALAIAVAAVAISTYLLSRAWAFRVHPARQAR